MEVCVLCRHLLALVFQTAVAIVSRRSHRDLAADSSRYLLPRTLPRAPPPPLFALFLSSPSLSQVLHGVDVAFRTLAVCILSLRTLLYLLLLACRLVDYVN